MIYLYLFGTCFHFIYVFMIIGKEISGKFSYFEVFCFREFVEIKPYFLLIVYILFICVMEWTQYQNMCL